MTIYYIKMRILDNLKYIVNILNSVDINLDYFGPVRSVWRRWLQGLARRLPIPSTSLPHVHCTNVRHLMTETTTDCSTDNLHSTSSIFWLNRWDKKQEHIMWTKRSGVLGKEVADQVHQLQPLATHQLSLLPSTRCEMTNE